MSANAIKSPWLTVQARAENETELLIQGPIGKSWWDDSGVAEKEFVDALARIPQGQKITVGINSEGGSVQDGLGIYNSIKRRAEDVTCRIDGYALSIASIIALGGGKTVSPVGSIWMIHEPSSVTAGNADDHMKAAEMLDRHGDMLAAIYASETGKSKEEVRMDMRMETWMTGEQAMAYGLCDEVTDGKPVLNAVDVSNYKNLPEALRSQIIPQSQDQQIPDAVTQSANASATSAEDSITTTDETETLRLAITAKDEEIAKIKAQLDHALESVGNLNRKAIELQTKCDDANAQLAVEFDLRRQAAVDGAIAANKIDREQRDEWINRIKEDPSQANVLQLMPCRLGAPIVPLVIAPQNNKGASESAGQLTGLARAIAAHSASKKNQ
jgi:ATP-dependent Clp endopeptidase proteolytic subunit ClpP